MIEQRRNDGPACPDDGTSAGARTFLLRLCAAGTDAAGRELASSFGSEEWEWIAERAADFRLGPLLHDAAKEHLDWRIPGAIRARWERDFRQSAVLGLHQQRAMVQIGDLFDRAGIRYVMLKGAALAPICYPVAALRPMRDVDVLVARETALDAYAALEAADYHRPSVVPNYGLEHGHHMPLLVGPDGVRVELHHTVGPTSWTGAYRLGSRLLATAKEHRVAGRDVRVATPEANLLHLVAHATLQNLFDNGPLTLSDLRFLIRYHRFDWEEAERLANELGLQRSFNLVLGLYDRYGGTGGPQIREQPPVAALDQASALIVQDWSERWQRLALRANGGSNGRTGSTMAAIRRALKPRASVLAARSGRRSDDPMRWMSYPKWLVEKGGRFISARLNRQLMQVSQADTSLERWLNEG